MGFTVICNGCEVQRKPLTGANIRADLGVSDKDFLFIFVGNINPNKNQTQVVDALTFLVGEGITNIKCAFIGGGDIDVLQSKIKEQNLSEVAFTLGFVEKSKLPDYYSASDATILTSLSEGFGLSIVEGYVYGKPNLTFSDLPAVKDLYSINTMLLCPNRQTKTLAQSMFEMTRRVWNREAIEAFAQKFSFEIMSKRYINFYKSVLRQR